MEGAVKVLLISSHPVQYNAPLYRLYAKDPRLEVTVAYCSLQGAEAGIDPEFGVEVKWDVPLLDGYNWVRPRNISLRPGLRGFFGLVNPGLWQLIKRSRFDVVVCYGYRAASFWIAALAARSAGSAVALFTDAHTLVSRDGKRWKAAAKRLGLPVIFGRADAAFGPSSATVNLLSSLGLPPDRIFLTPYVVETAFFSRRAADADRDRMRATWGIPSDGFVALFCGKLASWKRPLDLLEAAARCPQIIAIFAGDGPLRRALEFRAGQHDLSGRVRFLGFVNQTALPAVYAASEVLVLPSEYEAFGLVVNEAFACGVPSIVSSACGAAGDLVRDGETGFVVPVGDVSALAERLSLLAGDPDLVLQMGMNARARIREWGPEQNVEAFVEACSTLARCHADFAPVKL